MLTADLSRLLTRELDAFQREISLFQDDESVWRVVPGVTNSAGTLALHVAGNLQHFVGAVLGGTGYVRDRTAEFSTLGKPREHVVRELQAARDAVTVTLASLDSAALDLPYPAPPTSVHPRTGMFLLHLLAHAAFHLGQAGYIRRAVTGDSTSANPVAVDALAPPYPPEIAPMIMNGSAPDTTPSGSVVSGGSSDRSS
jgi:hypothetical protein